MRTFLMDLLQCPGCAGPLTWQIDERRDGRIVNGSATCGACGAGYPVRDEIAVFLTRDLQRNDLWAEVDSQLGQYLAEHPAVERQLMNAPVEELNGADLYYRAYRLDERGDLDQARATEQLANQFLYTSEHLAGWESQYRWVLGRLARSSAPVVDLASGRCYLVERQAACAQWPVVATDFAPSVLRRDKRYLTHLGLYDQVSLLAFDARRTPFRDGALPVLTTNLGLANIEDPAGLLAELRRIVSGELLAITHFFAADDEANLSYLRQFGMDAMMVQERCLEIFGAAGWSARIENACPARTRPTPASELLEGAQVDAIPVTETTITWCTLVAE